MSTKRSPRISAPRAAMPAGLELLAGKAGRAQPKTQQRFERLVRKIDRLKQRIRTWTEARPEIARELASYAELVEEHHRALREMVLLLDRTYPHPRFTKNERKKLCGLIGDLAGRLIEEGHDDLKPIYNRYTRSDFDAEQAAIETAGVETAKAMMEVFGIDLGDAEIDTMDDLVAFADAHDRAAEADRAARRARRAKSAKQAAREERREDEQRQAGKALQEVYRTLALALHPDHERDPEERARKNELMGEVNLAYEAKDLLRLLELQLQLERVDPSRALELAEDRLVHYCRILDEQARQLAGELDELELPFRTELELWGPRTLAPGHVLSALRADAADVEGFVAAIHEDLERFADPARLKAWLVRGVSARPRHGGVGFGPFD